MASHDLKRILANWSYQPGQITVRQITGDDGKPKIQMRLDLGILQMETEGRPDGQRPFNCESLLEYHRNRLKEYARVNGTDLGFELTSDECQSLREEAVMFYHRYLSLFVLEDFRGVERDTGRNLEVLDLCRDYAAEEDDAEALEPYRCYLIMMNTRAKAHQAIRREAFKTALAYVDAGLSEIESYLAEREGDDEDDEESIEDSSEAAILRALRAEIAQRVPEDPVSALQARLEAAIVAERYEEAAEIRDRLQKLRSRKRRRRTGDAGGKA
ncbi:MAG: UvrB/UvrC motif-containing protein [Phycisphaerae bacterium]|nr:UvrB/UvrC motif-containing protein [Phycisphaerae bacterium]NUQ46872.1 UvrB/UvrC motif-containing protein [Phycisphaerae bacterium]